MASMPMQLCEKGGRWYTRGWRGAKWLKRQTNKKWRQLGKKLLDDAPNRRPVKGWWF